MAPIGGDVPCVSTLADSADGSTTIVIVEPEPLTVDVAGALAPVLVPVAVTVIVCCIEKSTLPSAVTAVVVPCPAVGVVASVTNSVRELLEVTVLLPVEEEEFALLEVVEVVEVVELCARPAATRSVCGQPLLHGFLLQQPAKGGFVSGHVYHSATPLRLVQRPSGMEL